MENKRVITNDFDGLQEQGQCSKLTAPQNAPHRTEALSLASPLSMRHIIIYLQNAVINHHPALLLLLACCLVAWRVRRETCSLYHSQNAHPTSRDLG